MVKKKKVEGLNRLLEEGDGQHTEKQEAEKLKASRHEGFQNKRETKEDASLKKRAWGAKSPNETHY